MQSVEDLKPLDYSTIHWSQTGCTSSVIKGWGRKPTGAAAVDAAFIAGRVQKQLLLQLAQLPQVPCYTSGMCCLQAFSYLHCGMLINRSETVLTKTSLELYLEKNLNKRIYCGRCQSGICIASLCNWQVWKILSYMVLSISRSISF